MKALFDSMLASLLALFAGSSFAQAMDDAAASAPEPTVSFVWVIVFLAVFVGVCVWIGIAIWRNERKNRANTQQNAQP